MPPKSALPRGTTPRPPRRKKAIASKTANDDNINIGECDYRFGQTAPAITKSASKVRAKADHVASRQDTEKENTLNAASHPEITKVNDVSVTKVNDVSVTTQSQSRRHDEAMDSLNKSMAHVRLTSQNFDSSSHTLRKLQRITLPVRPLPPRGHGVPIALSDDPQPHSLQTSLAALPLDADLRALFTPSLLHAIQEASYSLQPTALILLEENSARLKSLVRTCLQRQHEHAQTPHWHWLRVAIHCLRAIHHTFVKDRAAGIKLAFHCVLLAERGPSERGGRKSREIKAVWEIGMLRLAAYEVLSRLVEGQCLAWEDMFTTVLERMEDNGLSSRQIVKICVESGVCASSVFLELGLLGLARGGTSDDSDESCVVLPEEFHFVSSVMRTCREVGGSTFQNIATRAVFPLMLELDVGDAVRHVKRIFRLFWEGGRSVENLSLDVTLRMASLHLQCLAVTILAQFVCEAFPLSNEEGRKELHSLWDKASSSALKMVAVFEKGFVESKDPKEMKSAILEVHSVAGGMLDNVWIQFYNHEGGVMLPPSSYYEYCSYRLIHQWKLLGFVDSIHTPEQLLLDKDVTYEATNGECFAAMASFSVVLLTIEARVAMENSNKRDSSLTVCERVISNFDRVVIRNAPSTYQPRCRSMILLLNLQGEASKIIASRSDSSRNGLQLSTIGYVLGRCMAPLETRLARLSDDPQRYLNLRLSAVDNYAKSAAFFDRAMEDSLNDLKAKWNTECVRQLRTSFELLSPVLEELEAGELKSGSPAVLAVEVFAKTASLIGRKRSDSMDMASSIQCHVYAAELLTRVASKSSSSDFFEKYQLSNRYMLLASALETNGNKEESCAALALAVWSAANKNAHSSLYNSNDDLFVGDTVSDEMLLFPERIIFDNQSPSNHVTIVDGLAVMVNKLARSFIEVFQSQQRDTCDVIPRDTLLAKLLRTKGTSESKSIIHLSRLLDLLLWDCGSFTITQTLELIRELLKRMSKVLKCTLYDADGCSEETFSAVVHELAAFLCLQCDRMKRLVSPEDMRIIQSALHIGFAIYLADSHMLHFPKPHSCLQPDSAVNNAESFLLHHSLDQLQQSEKLFSSVVEDKSSIRGVTFFAQWAAVSLQKAIMYERQWIYEKLDVHEHHDQTENAMMQQYITVLDICTKPTREMVSADDKIPHKSVESLIVTVKRLLCRFSLHGDPVSSSQCFVQLQKVYLFRGKSQSLFDSVSDFFLISSKFDELASMLIRSSVFDSTPSSKSLLGDEVRQLMHDKSRWMSNCIVDIVFSTLPHLSGGHTKGDLESGDLEQSLQRISESIETNLISIESNPCHDVLDFHSTCVNSDAFLQLQTFVITVLMIRSKVFLNARKPECSIKCLHRCRIECKRMISLMRLFSNTVRNDLLDDKLAQLDDWLSTSLERMSVAFSSLGIRKKAEDSAILAVLKQKIISIESLSMNKITFQELLRTIEQLDGQYNFLPSIRTLIKMKSLSLSPDKLSLESVPLNKINASLPCPYSTISSIINRSQNFITYDDSFRHIFDLKNQCNGFLSLAHQCILSLTHRLKTDPSSVLPLVTQTELEIALRIMRNESNISDTSASLERMTTNLSFSPSSLADAYYDLGIEALEKARGGKELLKLWSHHAAVACDDGSGEDVDYESVSLHFTLQARKYFNCALRHANPASSHTTKKILRCLALVTGPEDFSAFLIHASIGGASRSIVRDAIRSTSRGSQDFKSGGSLHNIFHLLDDETSNMAARNKAFQTLLSEYSSTFPMNWVVSGIALCPTGEILITSYRASPGNEGQVSHSLETVCIFQQTSNGTGRLQIRSFHRDILCPLDTLIERSQKQLCGINEEAQCERYNDESSKRRWWNERHSIDSELYSLLQRAENTYFGHYVSRRLLVAPMDAESTDRPSDDDSSECSDIGPGNLASRFDEAEREMIRHFDEDAERLALKKLTVANLKEKLNEFGVGGPQVQKLRKADLINLVVTEMKCDLQRNQVIAEKQIVAVKSSLDTPKIYDGKRNDSDEPCIILILDEHLHRFPLESMDMFANKAVSRMPSLPFVFAALSERQPVGSTHLVPQVDPNKVKFIIDPEQNLSETLSTINPALESMASANGWDWKGCVGKVPAPDFMAEALTQENSLLLYCGHGGGEGYFSRTHVEDFINYYSEDESDRHRGCSSTVVLMGCSSGKLKSVNTPKENPSGLDYPMYYEPEGIALSYLCAGAPCVIGNLWDVTDRDIDRYCLTLLNDFFCPSTNNSSAPNLAKCVATARRACKLRYIVGSAPVCYGIPVQLQES